MLLHYDRFVSVVGSLTCVGMHIAHETLVCGIFFLNLRWTVQVVVLVCWCAVLSLCHIPTHATVTAAFVQKSTAVFVQKSIFI